MTRQEIEARIASLRAQISAWNLIASVADNNNIENYLEGLVNANTDEIERLRELLRQS